MPPASTIGPSKNARTARTNTNGLSHPVCPPHPRSTAPTRRRRIPPHARRDGCWQRRRIPAHPYRAAAQHRRGDPTEVMTISGLCRNNTLRSCASRALERCTIRFGQTGAGSLPLASEWRRNRLSMSPSQVSSCSGPRQFTVGNAPITPLRQAATTRSAPETKNIAPRSAAGSGGRESGERFGGSLIS